MDRNCKYNICMCLGYESLVIPLKLINEGAEKVVICTNRRDVMKFCEFLNIPLIKILNVSLKDAAIHHSRTKKKIADLFKGYRLEETCFHITHKNFEVHSLIMAMYANYGNVYFHRTEIDAEKSFKINFWPAEKFKRNIKYLLYYWVLYRYSLLFNFHLSVAYRYVFGQLVPVVKDKWLKRNVNVIYYNDKRRLFETVYDNYSIDVNSCKNLFIVTDIDEISHWATRNSLERLYDFIGKHDITYKYHPNRRNNDPSIKNYYPAFIPAELLIKHTGNAVVGLISGAFRCSIKKKTIKSISCIDLIKWTDQEKKQFYRNYMNEWGEGIIYPKTEAELSELLRG